MPRHRLEMVQVLALTLTQGAAPRHKLEMVHVLLRSIDVRAVPLLSCSTWVGEIWGDHREIWGRVGVGLRMRVRVRVTVG